MLLTHDVSEYSTLMGCIEAYIEFVNIHCQMPDVTLGPHRLTTAPTPISALYVSTKRTLVSTAEFPLFAPFSSYLVLIPGIHLVLRISA